MTMYSGEGTTINPATDIPPQVWPPERLRIIHFPAARNSGSTGKGSPLWLSGMSRYLAQNNRRWIRWYWSGKSRGAAPE